MTPQRERALLSLLKEAWRQENDQLFGHKLTTPSFALSRGEGKLGSWDSQRKLLSIKASLFEESSWFYIVEVLRHEMAHQYVSEVLKVHDEVAHGVSFQEVCAQRGISSQAHAEPLGEEAQRLLSKVRKLLALATSDNAHEAELAATQARALIVKHHLKHLDEDLLGEHERHAMSACALGTPKGKHYQYEYALMNLLSDHFFVDVIWVWSYDLKNNKPGQVAEVCGRPEDLEIAEYVYHFLHNHLDRAWRAHKARHKLKGLKERLSFCLGVVKGFHAKLSAQNAQLQQERGLIQSRAVAVREFLRKRHPHIRAVKGGDWQPSQSYTSGFHEGQELTLRHGVHDRREAQGAPRQLTDERAQGR